MPSIDFSPGTLITSAWLDDIDAAVYNQNQGAVAAQDRLLNDKLFERVSAFDFFTVAQIIAAESYGFSMDLTTPLQNAINWAWTNNKKLYIPAGGYLTTGLSLTTTGTQRNQMIEIEGDQFGEMFYIGAQTKGTCIKSVTDAPIFRIDVATPPMSAGAMRLHKLQFDGNSATNPVIHLESFYGQCEISYCQVFQRGNGSGIVVDYWANAVIRDTWSCNADWVTYGLGAARTGVGFDFKCNRDAGLQCIIRCSARGWNTAYRIGDTPTAAYAYQASIRDSECSTVYNGVELTSRARACVVDNVYCEGGEGGVGFSDAGDYNSISNCFTFAGFGTHLKSTGFTYGSTYNGNTFTAGTMPNQVLIDITSSSVDGGPGKSIANNHLSFGGSGGSLVNVIGLRVNGVDPRINMSGLNFYPRGAWVGGAGTTKISDLSQSLDGTTTGGGLYGLGISRSIDEAVESPHLGRGSINLKVEPTTLTTSNLAAGVLTIGSLSVFTVTFASANNITRFGSPNLPDKTFEVHLTGVNTTLVHGTYIKLSGSANFTPGANGSWHKFQIKPGGVAYETARIAY